MGPECQARNLDFLRRATRSPGMLEALEVAMQMCASGAPLTVWQKKKLGRATQEGG